MKKKSVICIDMREEEHYGQDLESIDVQEYCYVCFAPHGRLLRNRCACRTCIHPHCLKKLLNFSQSSKCKVCLRHMTGVEVRVRRHLKVLTKLLIFADVLSFSMFFSFVFFVLSNVDRSEILWILPYSTVWTILFLFLLTLLHRNVYLRYDGHFTELRYTFDVVDMHL